MTIRNLIVLLMVSTGLFAQTVNGTVYDSNSRPLEGANVVLVGTELGDTANADGAYAMLNVPAGTYELKASFIGYKPMTETIVVMARLRSTTMSTTMVKWTTRRKTG